MCLSPGSGPWTLYMFCKGGGRDRAAGPGHPLLHPGLWRPAWLWFTGRAGASQHSTGLKMRKVLKLLLIYLNNPWFQWDNAFNALWDSIFFNNFAFWSFRLYYISIGTINQAKKHIYDLITWWFCTNPPQESPVIPSLEFTTPYEALYV